MGQRFFSAAFASLALVSMSCGGSQRATASIAASSAPSSSTPISSASPPARNAARGEIALLPTLETPWIAGRAGSLQHIVTGSLRADVDGGNSTFARERFTSSIVSATEVASGWAFVTRDGVVATSTTFTGSLVRRGNIGRTVWRTRIGHGRVVVIDEAGGVWTTDGASDARPVESLPDGPAIAAVFADVQNGAVVMDGGRLFVTRDGGTSWRGVDLGTDAAFNVFLRGTSITVSTTGGERGLDDTGRAVAPSRDALPDVDVSRFAIRQLLSRARSQDTSIIDAVDADRAVLRDGAWWIAEERDIRVIDSTSGATRREMRNTLPHGACALHAWGDALAATCTSGDGGLLRSVDGESFRAVSGGRLGGEYVFSDDGIHAARRGLCADPSTFDANAYRTDLSHVCVYTDGNGWSDFDVGDTVRDLLGMHGPLLLLRTFAHGGESPVHLLRASDDHVTALRIPRAADDTPPYRLDRASFTSEGWIAAIATQGEGRSASRVLFIGTPDSELTMRALPAGAESIGFLDARHGVAAGSDSSKLWRTVDGGDTWTPLTVPVDGERRAIPLSRESLGRRDGVRCAFDRCVVGATVLVRGLEDPAPSDRRVLAPAAQLPTSDEPRFGTPSRLSLPRLTCHAPGHARQVDAAGTTTDSRHRFSIAAAGVLADFDEQWTDGSSSARVRWRGVDGQGAFDVRASVANWSDDRTATYSIRGGTRAGLLVEKCRTGESLRGCELSWLTARGETHAVQARQQLADVFENRVTVENALALPDGGILVQLVIRYLADDAVDAIVRIAPDGSEVFHRSFAWRGSYGTRTLGSFRDASGYVVGEPGDPNSLRFYPLTRDPRAEAVALPRLDPQVETHVCAPERGNDAAQVLLTGPLGGPSLSSPEGEYVENMRATLELTRGGSCLRGVESWSASFGILRRQVALEGLRLTASANRRLTGTADAGGGTRRWTCEE